MPRVSSHQPKKADPLKTKVRHYRKLTQEALQIIELIPKLTAKEQKIADDFLSMARNYFSDGLHFEQQNELLTALAAYSYAHAWLDAGVRAGLFDAKENDRLFTLK